MKEETKTISVEEILNPVPEVTEKVEKKTKKSVKKKATGVVSECIRLRVRSTPDTIDNVLYEIPVGTVVEVKESESTENFYKVITEKGEGFCMKAFIALQ